MVLKRSEGGFDEPVSSLDEDKLGRSGIVDRIYSDLTDDVKDEWSVRVGLLSPWGGGKTSVCKMIEHKARKEEHITIWLSVWNVKDEEEFLAGVCKKICVNGIMLTLLRGEENAYIR